jgi:hypothetical protein
MRITMRTGSMRAGAASIALAAASAGCASPPVHCGTGLDGPRFGSAAAESWRRVASAPDTVAAEWNQRKERVGDSFSRLLDGRSREWELSCANAEGLWPSLDDECVDDRPPRLFSFLSRQGQRALDDAVCFPSRAWHSIKLAIE